MEAFKSLVNFLSYPQWSFTLSLVAFVFLFWSRKLWTKAGGLAMLVIGTVVLRGWTVSATIRLLIFNEITALGSLRTLQGGLVVFSWFLHPPQLVVWKKRNTDSQTP